MISPASAKRGPPTRSMAIHPIRSWIGYLASPVPWHLRNMGYVREMKALRARRNRCRAAWRPHLERTRALVLEAAGQCERRRKALIVGSGLLYDVPLMELSRQFDSVVLADVVHPWSVHRQAGRISNVRLAPLDVTGVVERCYALARARAWAPLPQRPVDCFSGETFDLVASVNVLSQLPVLPNGYMSRRIRSLTGAQTADFSRALVKNHLDWICSFPGVACLVADLERLHCDHAGTVGREESLWGVALPAGGREWYWDLAPAPEMDVRLDVRHRVVGYSNFPKQAWMAADHRWSFSSG